MNDQSELGMAEISPIFSLPLRPETVIVVGASLGGVEAISDVVGSLPSWFSTPIMVVIHTSPSGAGVMDKVLRHKTSLSVSFGAEGESIDFGHIYLAPPNHHMTVTEGGRLHLDIGPKEHYTRPAINRLFKSVADWYGAGAIAVILTGGDHDGGDGLRSIVAAGGTAIVQDPDDARDPEMPANALHRAPAQYVVPLIEIAPLLIRLSERKHTSLIAKPEFR